MPHRDPESGQFVSDGDGGHGLSYSDHDVHHVEHSLETVSGETNPPSVQDIRRFEITERGLDPDEIAELRAMRIQVGSVYTHNGNEDGPGTQVFKMGAGYNLADGEFLANEGSNSLDPDGDSTSEFTSKTGDTDEVGQLWTSSGTQTTPKDDETNTLGLNGQQIYDVEHLPLADMFGSGPFVDSADDFVSQIFLNSNRMSGSTGIRVRYSLYYNVMETESGRSRFGR